jgi:ketosteroid isomerase-like protein
MSTNRSARELLLAYLENVTDADTAIELFADDATFELPYLASLGLPWKWQGKDVLYKFLQNLPNTFPGFKFQNIRIHIDTPEQVFREYEIDAKLAKTGKPYHQNYMGRLMAENGKIKLIREALDMVQVAKSHSVDGIWDLTDK